MEHVRDLEVDTINQHQIATDHDVRVVRRRGREHHSRVPEGRAAFSSEAPAAKFHEPLVGVPIREEDDRAWPSRVGDGRNERDFTFASQAA